MRNTFLLLFLTALAMSAFASPRMLAPIWRNDEGPGDLGKVYYQTHEFCTPVLLDNVPFRVSEFSTGKSNKDADFENLRSSDSYDPTGANIQALIPQGSLVVLQDENRTEYRKVEVVSQARYDESDLSAHRLENKSKHPVAEVNQSGYLHRDSLEDIRHYFMILRKNKFTEVAGVHGLDLEDASLQVSQSKGKIRALNCCVNKEACEQFIIFNIERPDEKLGARQIAISARFPGLLASATAQPSEDENAPDDEKEEQKEQAKKADDKRTGGGLPASPSSVPASGTLDGAKPKADVNKSGSIAGVPINGETPSKVICVESGKVSVRGLDKNGNVDNASQFKVGNGQALVVRQSFDGARKSYKSGSETYAMIEVEFPALKKSGWVAEQFVKTESACSEDKKKSSEARDKQDEAVAATAALITGGVFPTSSRPMYSYNKGQASRWFGAGRSCKTKKKKRVCSRKHAACDLFRKQGDPARAILPGVVLQNVYKFYEGTWAVEIKHSNGKVVRYGEISGKVAPGIRAGAEVKQGQVVGYIKRVNSGCCDPMLHFELYSGKGRGALTQRNRSGYQRRSDLEDPTATLRKLEQSTFGKSW